MERLPEEVADRRAGEEVVAIAVRLAKALEVFSLASDARERLLLVRVRLVELLWWWLGGRDTSRWEECPGAEVWSGSTGAAGWAER